MKSFGPDIFTADGRTLYVLNKNPADGDMWYLLSSL
jgi:hypothetical protein